MKRTIKVSDEHWSELNGRKNPGDSFDDVIGRLLETDKELDQAIARLGSLEDVIASDHDDEMAEQTALALVRETREDLSTDPISNSDS